MTDLLTDEERAIIERIANSGGLDMRDGADLLSIIRDLHQRARVAIRDERYQWRNLLVNLIEEAENGSTEHDERTLRHLYERLASTQDQ